MTAQEANSKTKAKIMEFIPLQYDRIMENIEKCIAEGYFVYGSTEELYPENKQKLIDNGFKIRSGDGYFTRNKISWGNDKKDAKKRFFSFLLFFAMIAEEISLG